MEKEICNLQKPMVYWRGQWIQQIARLIEKRLI